MAVWRARGAQRNRARRRTERNWGIVACRVRVAPVCSKSAGVRRVLTGVIVVINGAHLPIGTTPKAAVPLHVSQTSSAGALDREEAGEREGDAAVGDVSVIICGVRRVCSLVLLLFVLQLVLAHLLRFLCAPYWVLSHHHPRRHRCRAFIDSSRPDALRARRTRP